MYYLLFTQKVLVLFSFKKLPERIKPLFKQFDGHWSPHCTVKCTYANYFISNDTYLWRYIKYMTEFLYSFDRKQILQREFKFSQYFFTQVCGRTSLILLAL